MGRRVCTRAAVKIIVGAFSAEARAIIVKPGPEKLWHYSSALAGNLFNQFTSDGSSLLLHNAASAFVACDPVVDIALDEKFLANGAPQSEVHGVVMRLTQWNCCRHSSVCLFGCPSWTRDDSIGASPETRICRESVTIN